MNYTTRHKPSFHDALEALDLALGDGEGSFTRAQELAVERLLTLRILPLDIRSVKVALDGFQSILGKRELCVDFTVTAHQICVCRLQFTCT